MSRQGLRGESRSQTQTDNTTTNTNTTGDTTMQPLSLETREKLFEMTDDMWTRMVNGRTTELQLWHVDRSEFRFCRPVIITQTYRRDRYVELYLCETPDGERIDSSDLVDHEPTLVADGAGCRYWQ